MKRLRGLEWSLPLGIGLAYTVGAYFLVENYSSAPADYRMLAVILTPVLSGLTAYFGAYIGESAKQRAILDTLEKNGYLRQKGEDLATKEDIGEITRKVEEVRQEFETVSHASKVKFETEFNIYKEIWVKLIPFQEAALDLRPMLGFSKPESEVSKDEARRLRSLRFSDKDESAV